VEEIKSQDLEQVPGHIGEVGDANILGKSQLAGSGKHQREAHQAQHTVVELAAVDPQQPQSNQEEQRDQVFAVNFKRRQASAVYIGDGEDVPEENGSQDQRQDDAENSGDRPAQNLPPQEDKGKQNGNTLQI